ncbi:FAD-dependent oxidoreductase [Thermomonospora amylolytica]|uniref:FAD-dependent oxidoreductase n=1 Tax=Thermomonospora amylolytica TaxID=1411117 RepID=UPI000E6B5435|nr:NAD(P)/FAD-dependent oxidoreductase [Thermomonospora amylolytica]
MPVTMNPHYDVVVLGGGTAGEPAAVELAEAGRDVALVEGRGTPYRAALPAASLLHSARRGEAWETAVARRDELTAGPDGAAPERAGVTVLHGYGRITGPGRVTVGETTVTCDDIVICTGSEPVVPGIEGLADAPMWTADEALAVPDLPRRLVVLGGGGAGCALAQVYAAFGSQVTLVEQAGRLLSAEAPFTGEILGDALRRMGVDLRLGAEPVKVERTFPGVRLWLSDGGALDADRVLVAAGRRPRTEDLALAEAGVDLTPGEPLPVDEYCRVLGVEGPVPGLWAAGDVTGRRTVHAAAYQARVAAAGVLGKRREADYRALPRVVPTSPAVYAVGVSPQEAANAGMDLLCAGYDLAATTRGRVERTGLTGRMDGGAGGRVELYADRSTGLLVGAAAVGPYAEEWMGEITMAIRAEIPLAVLTEVVHAVPAYGEAVEASLRELAARL